VLHIEDGTELVPAACATAGTTPNEPTATALSNATPTAPSPPRRAPQPRRDVHLVPIPFTVGRHNERSTVVHRTVPAQTTDTHRPCAPTSSGR